MKNNRQSRLVAILALCVAVVGLTLGFAAFSNSLTISSSATVSPDRKEFKLVGLGITSSTAGMGTTWLPIAYNSHTEGKAFYAKDDWNSFGIDYNNHRTTTAKISSEFSENGTNQVTISNIHATLEKPGDEFLYPIIIRNEGKYNAYILKSELEKYTNINDSNVCTPGTNDNGTSTTPDLVAAACEGITINIDILSDDNEKYLSTNESDADYILIDTTGENSLEPYNYGYVFVRIIIKYDENAARADGNFDVAFDDIVLEFTSAPPTE